MVTFKLYKITSNNCTITRYFILSGAKFLSNGSVEKGNYGLQATMSCKLTVIQKMECFQSEEALLFVKIRGSVTVR